MEPKQADLTISIYPDIWFANQSEGLLMSIALIWNQRWEFDKSITSKSG